MDTLRSVIVVACWGTFAIVWIAGAIYNARRGPRVRERVRRDQFWITLEYETEEPKDTSKTDSSGLTLSSLIDIFSRKPRDEQQVRGFDEIGPVRLDDLRKK